MKTLVINDFEHKDKYSSFEAATELWGKDYVNVYIDFPEDRDINECLHQYLPIINEQQQWLEANKGNVEKALADADFIELAEDWASSAEEATDEKDECYIMEDGKKVFLPITEKDFNNSLYLDSITISFEEEAMDAPEIELYILCDPDYFAGHSIQVSVDNEKNINCHGLAG